MALSEGAIRNIADNYRRMYRARYGEATTLRDDAIMVMRHEWTGLPSVEETDDAVLDAMWEVRPRFDDHVTLWRVMRYSDWCNWAEGA